VLSLFVLFPVAIFYVVSLGPAVQSFETKGYYSFKFIEREDIGLEANVECEHWTKKIYWTFKSYNYATCNSAILTVLHKNSEIPLSTNAYWTIDGEEQPHGAIIPINIPGGGSMLTYSKVENFDNFRRWRLVIPYGQIRNAKNVSFRWGAIVLEFGEKEFSDMERLAEKLEQLKSKMP
jgi:hypothetical protein